jgi:paraquat-inducible protein B
MPPPPPSLPAAPSAAPPAAPPAAKLRRRRFSFVWLIPLVAAAIAGYLGYRTILTQGPLLTLTFDTGEGLAAGQTQLQYKAVVLGTVEAIDLSSDNSHVAVKIRMNHVGKRFLNSHARFWVERPRFTPGDLSGLATLVSGAYIAVDPGPPGGSYQSDFTGLEEPPGVRSNEPGNSYILKADHIGSLGTGSPVYYRDVQVGEVLGVDLGNGLGPATVSIFVKAPFDNLVKAQSHFWNSSGITAGVQGGGFHIEFQSLQAIVSGAVTFDVPYDDFKNPPVANGSMFYLYQSKDDADAAGYQDNIKTVAYFSSSVAGLTKGSAVDILGIQVGEVTHVALVLDPKSGGATARVEMEIQPDRVASTAVIAHANISPLQMLQAMVASGSRAEVNTVSFVTGQKGITLVKVPDAKPAVMGQEGDTYVIPSQNGGLDKVIANLTDISGKIDKMPLDKIGNNLNSLLVSANKVVAGPAMTGTLDQLSATLKTANTTLGSVNQDFGHDSDFQRNLQILMAEATEALRQIKLLSQQLERNPQSLLLGKNAP